MKLIQIKYLTLKRHQQQGLTNKVPRYVYRCYSCKQEFEISHGMFHKQDICILCKRRDCIEKIPHFQIKKKLSSEKTRVGKVVDDFIVDAKEELKQQKKELKTEQLE